MKRKSSSNEVDIYHKWRSSYKLTNTEDCIIIIIIIIIIISSSKNRSTI